MEGFQKGVRFSVLSIGVNLVLAVTKIVSGVIGTSYALVADGIESSADIVSSFIVWRGLRISVLPADDKHPYGHGKAESLAGFFVALALLGAVILIAVQSIREIITPHHAPAPFTLLVLLAVVGIKEVMFRLVSRAGQSVDSLALRGDAWHHRSDALTSLAAFVGISIALIGGPGYESADDWAALAACLVIAWNGFNLLRPALDEMMDAAVPESTEREIRRIALEVDDVRSIDKCRGRKSGLGLLMDIHVMVDGGLSVRRGHEIAHQVTDRLRESHLPIHDVVVHVEPAREEDLESRV
ncbi:MAG: cation diffusion facilitator family transporter [Opitutaceae bacterium]